MLAALLGNWPPVLQEILAEMGGKPDFIIGNYRLGAGRGDVEEAG